MSRNAKLLMQTYGKFSEKMYICDSREKKITNKMHLGADIIKCILRLLALQPLKWHYFWGRCISWLARVPMRYRKDVVMINLARSFPEKKYNELLEIAKKFYDHFGRIVAETIWFAGSYRKNRLEDSKICHYRNLEMLRELFDTSPSVMVMTSHVGNWELLGGCMHYKSLTHSGTFSFTEDEITIVYKELSSKTWDKVMLQNRCTPVKADWSSGCVKSKEIIRFVVDHRREKRLYCFPTDQCPYKYATSHTVDNFLHQPTKTMTGGAALACKLKMSVCYMGMEEVPGGGYTITFEPICKDASQTTPEEIMNKFYALLAKDVEAQPWNYLWTHKRWKK